MAKVSGKDLDFKIGSPLATIGIFDINMDENADEIDVTDSMSSGDAREYLAGFVNRSLTYSRWYSDTDTPEDVGDEEAFSWKAGAKTFTGTILITGRTVGATREDAHRYNYTARITGDIAWA